MASLDIDTTGLDQVALRLAGLEDTDELLEDLMVAHVRQAEEAFAAEVSPRGEAWAPNDPDTVRRKGTSEVGRESGRLLRSIGGETLGDRTAMVGSEIFYALFFQSGTRSQPARPFLAPVQDRDVLLEAVGRHLDRSFAA